MMFLVEFGRERTEKDYEMRHGPIEYVPVQDIARNREDRTGKVVVMMGVDGPVWKLLWH